MGVETCSQEHWASGLPAQLSPSCCLLAKASADSLTGPFIPATSLIMQPWRRCSERCGRTPLATRACAPQTVGAVGSIQPGLPAGAIDALCSLWSPDLGTLQCTHACAGCACRYPLVTWPSHLVLSLHAAEKEYRVTRNELKDLPYTTEHSYSFWANTIKK